MRLNVEEIDAYGFDRRRIRRLELGRRARRIGDGAFSCCPLLEEVAISEGLESVGRYVFQDSPRIRELRLPSTLVEIPDDAFFLGSDGTIERFVVHPDNPAYRSVDGVLFTKDMRKLVQFPQMKDTSCYVVPDTVETIADSAFSYAVRLERIDLPEGLRTIGSGAFEWCESLRSVRIPEGVGAVPMYAFFCCYALEEVALPERLEALGSESFANCTSLKEFDIPPGFDQLDYAVLGGCDSLERVSVPEGIADVNNSAFLDCPRLRSVRLPSTVVAIWEKAFQRCSRLEEINIPPEVYHVSEDAFQGCDGLRRIYVEGDLETKHWVPEGAEVICGSPPPLSGDDRSKPFLIL